MPWALHITPVQQGLIVQNEFAKLVMMGSKGRIELAPPLTDDERRDWELHVRGQFGFGLAIQVKSTMHLQMPGRRRTPILHCSFKVPVKHLVTSPLFYYFLGYLDPKLMRLADPAFLIPSTVYHRHAIPIRKGAYMRFTFMGSMSPTSHDVWQPYQVNTLEVGQKIVEIIAKLRRHRGLTEQSAQLLSVPDALWLRPVSGRHRPRRPTQAA
jgi:hypothetical protein